MFMKKYINNIVMSFKEFYLQDLEELFVHGTPTDDTDNVIAYRQNVWMLPNTITVKQARDIFANLDISSGENYGDNEEDPVEFYEIDNYIRDSSRSDVLTGSIREKILFINSGFPYTQDPKSSNLIKKVVKQLKLKGARYFDGVDGDDETYVSKKKITGNIPDIAFHGTSLKYLDGILKSGIRPKYENSNYKRQGISHDSTIFFATKFGDAMGHAVNSGNNTKSTPVVIEFYIPDKNLLIADYDVDMQSGETTYDKQQDTFQKDKFGSEKSFSVTKELGVYGYRGSILPQHIKYIYIATTPSDSTYSAKNFKRYTKKQIYRLINQYGDLDILMTEADIEPELKQRDEFDSIKDPNPKEVIGNTGFSARIQEPSDYSEGYVFVYDNKTNKIATRLFWEWNTEFKIQTPQTHFIETSKEYSGKNLSLLAYSALIETYEKLITDNKLTQMSVNNWSKHMYPKYKNNIFLISHNEFKQWNGNPNEVVGNERRIIILMDTSDIKRLQRKYSNI
jgi:hypothetical protein